MRRLAAAAALLATCASVAVAATYPAPSLSLQSSFSPPTGIARTDFINEVTSSVAATVVDGDRILTVGEAGSGNSGDVGVEAHRLDGTLDTSFSEDGRLVIAVTAGSVEDRGVDVVVLPDRRIRILAATGSGSTRDTAIIGLTVAGAPDPEFGAWDATPADGIVTFGLPPGNATGVTTVPAALARAADGRLAVTGSAPGATDDSFVALRNADGTPVATFGGAGGLVKYDRSGDSTADAGVDVGFGSAGVVVLGQIGASGATSAYLRAFDDLGAPNPAFSEDGDLVPAVGDAPTEPHALLAYNGRLWLTGSTRTGVDTNAFLARVNADGTGLQSRQFDMRGQLVDPAAAVTSVGDGLAVAAGVPDTLIVTGSVASSASTDWAAAAFNNLDGDVASAGFGDIAISIPGSGGINAVGAGAGGAVFVAGPYQETVTTPSSSITYTRIGEARLLIDAEKACNMAVSVPKPLELTMKPGVPGSVDLKVTNGGTRACAGVITAPDRYTLTRAAIAGPIATGTLAPGETFTATGVTVTYTGVPRRQDTLAFTLAAAGDADTSDNTANLRVAFRYCDLRLIKTGAGAFMPSEGSRRFGFTVRNRGTTACTGARIGVTGQGRGKPQPRYTVAPGKSVTDAVPVRLRKRAKAGDKVLIGFRTAGSDDAYAANDAVAIGSTVLKVGDTRARRPRGAGRVLRGSARGGRGPASSKLRRVTRVDVAVRRIGGGCRWLASAPKVRFRTVKAAAKGRCTRPVWLRAAGTSRWRLRTAGLPAGKYELLSRATIGAGFREASFTVADRNSVRFRTTGR